MFGALDYVVFCSLMASSAIIGLYFGFCSRQNSAIDYLLGGRNMGMFPVTMSMIASAISGVTLLGVPTEIYTYGTQYALNAVTDVLVCTVTAIVFVPVYYNLQVQSTYEYLEMRYDKTIRYLLAAIYCFSSNFYMPLVMYVPALALSQVTGINIFLISSVTTAICVFYTCVLVRMAGRHMAGSQPNLQRCLALPTLAKAQRATIAISKSDQVLPYFVADIGRAIPGIAGLFVAGIFAAALSSLSTTLNSVSAVMVHDLLRPCLKRPMSELQESRLLKLVVLVLGLLSRTLGGLTGASRLGIFLFGVAVPWVKARAVLAGGIFTSLAMAVRVVGLQTALASGDLVFPKKPISMEACPDFEQNYLNNSEVFWLFRFSYFWNSLVSLLIMTLATAAASLVFGVNDPRDMDHRLFSPVVRPFLPEPRNPPREL
ncbi:hypothetical protein B566_EDAN014591, partial [Ephemera danica]